MHLYNQNSKQPWNLAFNKKISKHKQFENVLYV